MVMRIIASKMNPKMNKAYGSCDDFEGVEEPCWNSYNEDEVFKTSQQRYEDNVRYKSLFHIFYEHL